ncbi:MAG TPA: PadR family transcriptional regulator [Streptosporangiaceae bacterium]
MSYIEIVILRRLFGGPCHGYELRKRVEEITGVTLHNNSLYPALKRFEEAGAVTKAAQEQQGRPARLVYTITDTGRELLHDMLAGLPPDQAADDSEFLVRLGQFSLISRSEQAVVLANRTAAVRDRLAHLRALRDTGGTRDERWGVLVTDELTRRDERELDWLAGLVTLAESG